MTRLRVLMVSPTGVMGGAERLLVDLVAHADSGNFVPVVVLLRGGPLRDELAQVGCRSELVEIGRFRQAHRTFRAMQALRRVILQQAPDVIYSNMATSHLFTAGPARLARCPAIWHQSGFPDPPTVIDRVASRLPGSRVLAVSRAAAEAQRQIAGSPPVVLFEPGIQLSRFESADGASIRRQYGIGVETPLVGIVGRLQEWKGQREFLRAAARVAAEVADVRFAVVGGAILGWEGGYPDELKRLAEALGLKDRVIFTGHVGNVPDWLDAIDVAVNASAPEPFGISIVEAMACGCAVVAVDAGGPKDIITDGVDGLLAPTSAPADLAERIMLVLRNQALRVKIAAAAHARASDHYDARRMASDFGGIARDSVQSARREQAPAAVGKSR